MDISEMRGISLEGSAGENLFLLEIPRAALEKAAAELGLDEHGVQRRLHDLLCGLAHELANEARGQDYPWRFEGFRWESFESRWQRTYGWRDLEPLLHAEAAIDVRLDGESGEASSDDPPDDTQTET